MPVRETLPSRFRRGELRFWLSYWVWGVGGNMGLLGLLILAWVAGAPVHLLWALWLAGMAWHAFIWGGVWRSGRRYDGPGVWVALSRFGLFLGIPRLLAEAWLLAVRV